VCVSDVFEGDTAPGPRGQTSHLEDVALQEAKLLHLLLLLLFLLQLKPDMPLALKI